ncbi:hypothetical protein [Lysobacter antibioticus]|uniref:hypothetical protein n=1 Tax=Lysobacter antibioticus TaxID=84531 RepID=UPI0011873694|nr:hypothetical protein [Lysobacter antibioticus]
MKIQRTSDVALVQIDDLYRDLRPYMNVEIDSEVVGYKSTDAPSWIKLAAELSWWQQGLSAYAALYIAELVKEAAKESWRARGKIVSGIFSGANSLRAIARAIMRSVSTYETKAEIILFLPEPDRYFGTGLRLLPNSSEDLEVQLALFVHYLPKIKEVIDRNSAVNCSPATGYFLQIIDDGGLLIEWFHATTLEKQSEILPLTANA